MIVTVFGSAQPISGSERYIEAFTLGKILANAGHIVATGGYMGTMEAVSMGASDQNGHVIGVTCLEIEKWRNTKVNKWVKEEIVCTTLIERLNKLITICDCAIALPGGPGTLTEISLMWNLMIIQAIPRKKLFLIGNGWKHTILACTNNMGEYFSEHQREMLTFLPSIDTIEQTILEPKLR